MARRKQLKGMCAYCAREMTGGGLTRHLKTCKNRLNTIKEVNQRAEAKISLYHLLAKSGRHWLHLEMRGTATLEELDSYLRSIWLECCGHLSQFQIGPYTFSDMPNDGWGESESLDVEVSRLFRQKMSFEHEYDFGSTTESKIQVMDERRGVPTTPHPIALMARNDAPKFECLECGEDAVYFCQECVYSGPSTLCEEHSEEHECGEEMLIELVNSPRIGECGYDGPAEPPY